MYQHINCTQPIFEIAQWLNNLVHHVEYAPTLLACWTPLYRFLCKEKVIPLCWEGISPCEKSAFPHKKNNF